MFKVKLIQRDEFGAWAIKLKNSSDGLYYWMDAYIDWSGENYGDIVVEWNQYIFHIGKEDRHRMEVQDDEASYDFAQSEVLSALFTASEIIERPDGRYEVNEAPAHWGRIVEIKF